MQELIKAHKEQSLFNAKKLQEYKDICKKNAVLFVESVYYKLDSNKNGTKQLCFEIMCNIALDLEYQSKVDELYERLNNMT